MPNQQIPGRVISGARALVQVFDGSQATTLGIFSQVSYGLTYEYGTAFILGRYSAASIDYTSVDVVQMQCHGYRVVGAGWHEEARLPYVSEMLYPNYLTFQLFDRGTKKAVAKITNVLPTSASGGYTARQLSEIQVTYVGLLVTDESDLDFLKNVETAGAASLP
jgi:hypothetical protein